MVQHSKARLIPGRIREEGPSSSPVGIKSSGAQINIKERKFAMKQPASRALELNKKNNEGVSVSILSSESKQE
jgi:hypothetical protein